MAERGACGALQVGVGRPTLFCLWPKSLELLEGCFSWADTVHWGVCVCVTATSHSVLPCQCELGMSSKKAD